MQVSRQHFTANALNAVSLNLCPKLSRRHPSWLWANCFVTSNEVRKRNGFRQEKGKGNNRGKGKKNEGTGKAPPSNFKPIYAFGEKSHWSCYYPVSTVYVMHFILTLHSFVFVFVFVYLLTCF